MINEQFPNMTIDDSKQQQFVNQQSLLLLVSSLNKVIIAFPTTSTILAFIFWPQVSSSALLLWLAAVYIAAIYRAVVHKGVNKFGVDPKNYDLVLRQLLFLDFYSGLVLGFSGYFLLSLSVEYQWLLIIVVAAMSTNSVSAQAVSKNSVLAFNVPLYISYMVWFVLAKETFGVVLVFLLLAHAVFLLGHYKALHKYIINSMELTYKNQLLANDLASKNTQLVKSNKQVKSASLAKSQFIAQLSHQLKEPVQAMITALDNSKKLTNVDEIYNSLNAVQASGSGLLLLFNDLIDVNRLEQGQLARFDKVFNVREHFENLASLVTLNAENKNLSIYCNINHDVAEQLCSDPLRISQITLNLLANAIKFTEHGEIGIEVSSHQSQQQNWLSVNVTDTGCGISDDKKDYVFQPFVHGSSAVKRIGNGLGLAISQELVKLLDGTISVVSSVGKGSIFSYKIPVEIVPQPLQARKVKIQKILLIESNNNQRQALINQLKYLFVPFEIVASAKDAMALCASNSNRYQAVLMGEQDKLQQKLLINLCQRVKIKVLTIAKVSEHLNDDNSTLTYPVKTTALLAALRAV